MNLPDFPFLDWLYFLINTPGGGSIVAVLVATIILISVVLMLRWIVRGAEADESEEYAYPTPALHRRE